MIVSVPCDPALAQSVVGANDPIEALQAFFVREVGRSLSWDEDELVWLDGDPYFREAVIRIYLRVGPVLRSGVDLPKHLSLDVPSPPTRPETGRLRSLVGWG